MEESKEPKESRESRPREKITLDTEIPALPPKAERLPAPDEEKHERDVKIVENKINRLRDKKKGIHDKIKEKKEGGKMDDVDKSVKDFIGEKITNKKEFAAARGKLLDEKDGLRREFFEMIEEQKRIKPKIKIFDKEKTERAIENIERKIETTTIDLHEEKKLISELSTLQQSLPLINAFNARSKKIDENKRRQEVINAQIDALSGEIKQTKSIIDETNNKIRSGKDNLKQELPTLFEESKKIQAEIDTLEEERKGLQEEFREKKFAYQKQQNLIKHVDFVTKMKAKLVEQEERRKKQEEYEKQDELNKPHPYANEILSCDAFISYLSKFIPKQISEKAENKQPVGSENYLPDKSELNAKETESWFGASVKKPKKKRVKKQKNTEGQFVSHPIDLMNFFSYCGIKVPTNPEEAKAAIDELVSRKKHWEALEKREEDVEEKKSKKHDDRKHTDLSLNPVNFPAPEDSKAQEKYGIFKDEGPVLPVEAENIRGKRGKRRGGK